MCHSSYVILARKLRHSGSSNVIICGTIIAISSSSLLVLVLKFPLPASCIIYLHCWCRTKSCQNPCLALCSPCRQPTLLATHVEKCQQSCCEHVDHWIASAVERHGIGMRTRSLKRWLVSTWTACTSVCRSSTGSDSPSAIREYLISMIARGKQ